MHNTIDISLFFDIIYKKGDGMINYKFNDSDNKKVRYKCSSCNGAGYFIVNKFTGMESFGSPYHPDNEARSCPKCGGTGYYYVDKDDKTFKLWS